MACAWSGCVRSSPAPYDDVLHLEVHVECVDAWWESCGPLPAPIVIRARVGPDAVVGTSTLVTTTDPESDPAALRARGVLT